MYGWEKLASVCGLGCKVFMSPWASSEKSPYDPVLKLDDLTESCDPEPVVTEPQKPDWGDISARAPIVRKQSNSAVNINRPSASYEKLSAAESMPKLNNKRLSKPDLAGSRGSLAGSRTSLAGSRTSLAGSNSSNDVLEVTELVTTV